MDDAIREKGSFSFQAPTHETTKQIIVLTKVNEAGAHRIGLK